MRSDFEPHGQPDPEDQAGSFIANARRTQIKAAAVDTLVELGYAKTSLAQIAKRAGISKGVISYHFSGKNELLEKLVTEFYGEAAYFVISRLETRTSARDMLRAYIEANIEVIAANRQSILAISEIIVNFRGPDGKLWFGHKGNNELVEGVAVILRQGQQDGEFGEFDPWVVASSLRQSMDLVSAELGANPELDTAHYARELVNLFDRATRRESP